MNQTPPEFGHVGLPAGKMLFRVGEFLYATDAHGKVVQAKGVLPPQPSTGEREAFAQQTGA